MISKRCHIKPENDNYKRLANYIAGDHSSEKVLVCWNSGCWAGDDFDLAITEVEDTQALNTRTTKEKTYHLVVSFRPEDENRLTNDVFKEIEEAFAKSLGLEEHQRHCGIHKDTNNLHMHIAYNLIHPERLTRHAPYMDYYARDRVCRELELKYDLSVDNGRNPSLKHERLATGAATVEAHTGQQSFESYAKEHKAAIMTCLESAANWQDLHNVFAEFGMEIKPHGNGLVVKNLNGKQAIKASSLDRGLSEKKLELLLGPYVQAASQTKELMRYEAAPLHRSPDREGQKQLYLEYIEGIETRKNRLTAIKTKEDMTVDPIKAKWEAKRQELQSLGLPQRSTFALVKLARNHEAEELVEARQSFLTEKAAVKQDIPYTSWVAFLQGKAGQGNEVALAILQSKGKEVGPHAEMQNANVTEMQLVRDTARTKAREVLESDRLLANSKKGILAVIKMQELAALDACQGRNDSLAGITHRIDKRGNVLFSLASGGMVRDTGKEVFFSFHDKIAQEAALRYAQIKWGKNITFAGNQIRFVAPEVKLEKEQDLERLNRSPGLEVSF